MRYSVLSFREILKVWRILVAVIVCQIVGSAIGLAYGYHHFWFKNLWAGGVLSIPLGLVLGLAWHFFRTKERGESVRAAKFLAALGTAVFVFAIVFEFPDMRSEMQNLERIARLPEAGIRRIEVFRRYGMSKVTTLSDPETVAAFTHAVTDAVGHSPNHPRYTHSWRVVATGPGQHVFELHLDPTYPDSVIGYFIETSDNTTFYRGSFRSVTLRPWVEAHLPLTDATERYRCRPALTC